MVHDRAHRAKGRSATLGSRATLLALAFSLVLVPGLVSAQPYPVAIEHKYGTLVLHERPRRVVTIGFSEQDPVLALGTVPVAIRYWFGPEAGWPWAKDRLGSAQPEVLHMPFGELDMERIASLRPDLIVATHSGINKEEYDILSRIAPTLAQSAAFPDFGMPWEEQTLFIGRALGKEQEAKGLIAQVEEAIADARRAHQQFGRATIAWISPAEGQGQYWAVGPNTPPMRFLAALGFRLPDQLAQVIGTRDSAPISAEQLHLADADVIIFQVDSDAEKEAFLGDPIFSRLAAVRQKRLVLFVGLDDPVYGALSYSTVLSLPYALEHLVPRLADALAGRGEPSH